MDVPTSKKEGQPSKRGKASALPKKKKTSSKMLPKKATKEVVDLDGGSSSEGEGSARKWRDYKVDSNLERD